MNVKNVKEQGGDITEDDDKIIFNIFWFFKHNFLLIFYKLLFLYHLEKVINIYIQ